MIKLPAHKKSSVGDAAVVESACSFCERYNPGYGDDCKAQDGDMRELCLLAFSAKVQNAVDKLTSTA